MISYDAPRHPLTFIDKVLIEFFKTLPNSSRSFEIGSIKLGMETSALISFSARYSIYKDSSGVKRKECGWTDTSEYSDEGDDIISESPLTFVIGIKPGSCFKVKISSSEHQYLKYYVYLKH